MGKHIPYLSLDEQHNEVRGKLVKAFKSVFEKGNFILGNEVQSFEREYAKFSRVGWCAGVASGLDALYLSLTALSIGKGDEVIVPSNTCVPTWLAVAMTGATVVPVEPDISTFNIDPARFEAAITSKTRAVIPVHLFGQPCDMARIMAIAATHNIHVVEDNAQAHGALFSGMPTGAFGVINATSFYPTKNLGALGDGGAITTNSEELVKTVSKLRNYGTVNRSVAETRGINSRLDELQAAVLRIKLSKLAKWNKMRTKIAANYLDKLKDVGDIILPKVIHGATHVYHVFAVRTKNREALREHLLRNDIETLVHYPVPPHLQTAFSDLSFTRGQFPIAEELAQTSLSLPIWPGLDEKSQDRVIKSIKRYFK